MDDHPGNPWWDHERNVAVMIRSPGDWEEARASGHLLVEHVFQRMQNMIHAQLGTDGEFIAFDEAGFVKALTAASAHFPGGVTLCVYPKEHPPPHVHVKLRSHPGAKIRISLEDGSFLKGTQRNLAGKLLRQVQDLVRENRTLLAGWWESYQGEPVVMR